MNPSTVLTDDDLNSLIELQWPFETYHSRQLAEMRDFCRLVVAFAEKKRALNTSPLVVPVMVEASAIKPLTEDEIKVATATNDKDWAQSKGWIVDVARAVEAALNAKSTPMQTPHAGDKP